MHTQAIIYLLNHLLYHGLKFLSKEEFAKSKKEFNLLKENNLLTITELPDDSYFVFISKANYEKVQNEIGIKKFKINYVSDFNSYFNILFTNKKQNK